MTIIKLQDYCKAEGFVQITKAVRTNVNGYPFVTFITADNVSTNIYLSKASAEGVIAGQVVDKDFLRPLSIGVTTNAAGEERIKLCSNSERIDLDGMFD